MNSRPTTPSTRHGGTYFFEHECNLHCRTPRVKTDTGKVRLITPPWAGLNSGFTLLFEAHILQLCTHMPMHNVGRIVGETDSKLWRRRWVHRARAGRD